MLGTRKKSVKPSIRSFIPLLLIIFTYSLGYFLVMPVFFRLVLDNSTGLLPASITPTLKYVFLSLCIGLDAFGYMIGAPVMGTWSDTLGRKKLLRLSLGMTLIGYSLPLIGIIRSEITWIFIGRIISGFASSSQSLAQSAVADISNGTKKATYFAVITIVMTIALLIGPPMGSYLSDSHISSWFNEKTPFYIALILVVTTMLLMRFYSDHYQKKNEDSHLTIKNLGLALREAFSSRYLSTLFVLFFLSQMGWAFFYQDIMLYLTQKFHFSLNSASLFMAYAGICMSIGLAIYKFIIRYVSLQTVLLLSFISCTISFFFCGISNNIALLYFFIIPGAIGAGLTQPTIMTMLSDAVRPEKQGWVLGVAASSFAAPWCISAFLFGVLSEADLSYPLIISLASFIIANFILLNKFIKEKKGLFYKVRGY